MAKPFAFSPEALLKFREFAVSAGLTHQPHPQMARDQHEWPKNGSAEDPARVRAATNPPRGETQHQSFLRDSTSTNVGQNRPTGFASTGSTAGPDQASGGERQLRSVLEGLGLAPETVEEVLRAVVNGGDQANNMGGAMPPPLTSDDPDTEAAPTALKPNKYQSLMELLDALELEHEDEIDGEQPDEGIVSGGGSRSSGMMMEEEPLKPLPMREALPTPVKLPAAKDSASYATGDAAIIQQRRAVEHRLDRHLRENGLRSEAHRNYVIETGQRIRAKKMANDSANAGDTLDDFLRFRPGAGKIDVL
jgi:hypothetical protein